MEAKRLSLTQTTSKYGPHVLEEYAQATALAAKLAAELAARGKRV